MLTLDEGHVTTVAVDPGRQRQGLGARLMLTLARAGIARGARHLTLEVRMSNSGAQAMYQRFGFAPAGVRKGYYVETNEDALVMWAHDVDLPGYEERLGAIESGIVGTTTYEEGILP
jgi:ribosomal-protein-alanine N-acetyltransferase